VAPYLEAADRMIVVDHHVPKVRPGHMRIVMEEAPATAAILADLLIPTGKVNAQVADNLLAGILTDTGMTDTGNFRFPNTTPHCLNLAAQLIELGANLPNMAEQIYHCVPLPALRLLGWAITNLKATPNEDLVYVSLPLSVYQELAAREQDTEGIVNELLSTRHARIAFVLRERKPGVIRGSLRSRGNLDVAAIANQFGGGGYRQPVWGRRPPQRGRSDLRRLAPRRRSPTRGGRASVLGILLVDKADRAHQPRCRQSRAARVQHQACRPRGHFGPPGHWPPGAGRRSGHPVLAISAIGTQGVPWHHHVRRHHQLV